MNSINRFLLTKSILSLCLVLLFPNLAKSQDIPSQQSLPKVNRDIELLLNQPNQDIPLQLVDAVYLALQNNRDVKMAYIQRIIDRTQLSEAEAKFNPVFTTQLSLDLRNQYNGSNYSISDATDSMVSLNAKMRLKLPTGADFNLQWYGENFLTKNNLLFNSNSSERNILANGISVGISQPLLRDFGVGLNSLSIQTARLTEKANLLTFRNSLAQTITTSIISYRKLLLAQERLKIEQVSFANAKEELKKLETLLKEGKLTENDLVERRADLAQKEVNLVAVQSDLTQAISDLTEATNLPLKMLVAAEKPLPPDSLNLPSFEEMIKLAEENSVSYLYALNNVENAKFSLRQAKNQQKLDLRLNVSYNYALNNYGYYGPDNIAKYSDYLDYKDLRSSLTLSRDFGNVYQDNAVLKSELDLQKAQYSLQTTKDNVNEELRNRVRNVKDSYTQIKLSQQATVLAQLRLNSAKERMKNNSNVSMTDIINFEKGVVDAKNQELNAIITHLNFMAQLEQFLGITLNKWVQQ
ncbi:TolC family protein [Anabaena sp. FACHB-1237]|uniref:TolC family protein n=1 Tax=Anabaena sp. FACHB-1237 TaxID=2692769 RepID=UPI00168089BA|nr:TolC family protein [Anabaena sp. FACHB-1237]MBD2136680.1 TolC family protein [Anabaena sp. FACHB-1237]